MAVNTGFAPIREAGWLRGFKNLLNKEHRSWWRTRRWWVNALLWPLLLCGLMANMLFVPTVASLASEAEVARAGGLTAYILTMGLSVFFEFGASALAIGVTILSQDLILNEKQNGVTEWLLSKPVARRAYMLAKLVGSGVPVLLLLIGLPSTLAYSMLSLRMGAMFPWIPFLSAVGIVALHTFFYLSLTLTLGTFFNSRAPILAIALGSALGGALLGGFVRPLLYVTPWILPKVASLIASSQPVPAGMLWLPITASILWCLVFVLVALARFEKMEF